MIRLNLIPSDFEARKGKALTLTEAYRSTTFWPDTKLEVGVELKADRVRIWRQRVDA